MIRIRVKLWLDPLDLEFNTIAAILDGLLCIAGSVMLLPAILAHPVVVRALVADVRHTRRLRLVPHETHQG